LEPMQRLAIPAYADGIMSQREAKSGNSLPNARKLSLELFSNPFDRHPSVTEMTAYWFHFVATDIGEVVPNQCLIKGLSVSLPCCLSGFSHPDCDQIDIPASDSFYKRVGVSCLPHSRTLPAPREDCQLGHREQANKVSSFIDASPIYGSSKEAAQALRVHGSGRLQTSSYFGLYDLLPTDLNSGHYSSRMIRRRSAS